MTHPPYPPERLHAWLAASLPELLPNAMRDELRHHRSDPIAHGDLLATLCNGDMPDADPPSLQHTARLLQQSRSCRRVHAALAWADHPNRAILPPDHPDYPPTLLTLPEFPPLLYIQGSLSALQPPAIAIIGSRNASQGGLRTAARLARDLAEAGLVVVSGLARGIDAAAHQGCLDIDASTVAVLGSACDRCYPAAHATLARQIAAGSGTLMGEFPPGTPLRPWNFPRRNRLISGLSLAVIVVEAGPRSGSLGTARHAAEQGREVMAVPGSVHAPNSRGCHKLLREGAILVESADDVLFALSGSLREWLKPEALGIDPDSRRATVMSSARDTEPDHPGDRAVLKLLGHDRSTVDELIAASGTLDAASVHAALSRLELAGFAARDLFGFWQRVVD